MGQVADLPQHRQSATGVLLNAYNPSTLQVKAEGPSSRPALAAQQVQGQMVPCEIKCQQQAGRRDGEGGKGKKGVAVDELGRWLKREVLAT